MNILTTKDGKLTETGETYYNLICEAIDPIVKEMVEKDFSFAEIQYIIEIASYLEIYNKRF